MSFLNPGFLGALALVGVPLLIHLIRRRRLSAVRWAAMEFLRQSQERQRRRLRIEEMVLLAVRMAIVAAVCLAFARPVMRALGVPLLAQNTHVYAVIVMDNSFSMGYRGVDGRTSFEHAQEAAGRIVEHVLRPGDAASLLLLSDRPDPLVGAPSFDLTLVGRRARAARLSDRGTDYLATAQKIGDLIRAARQRVNEVYWITDDQAQAWSTSRGEAARGVWQAIGRQARINWISVGPPAGSRDNLAVESPELTGNIVTPRLPARIEARVVNYGVRPRQDVLVNIEVDGRPAGATRVSVPAGGAATARFVTTFSTAGSHTGRIALDDADHADALPRDNSAPFVVRCRDRLRILIQDSSADSASTHNEAFYLLTALAPGGQSDSFAPRLHVGEGLGNVSLREYDTVALVSPGAISEADGRALTDYVTAGGGLLIFPGPGTDGARLNADLSAAGLLPAHLGVKETFSQDTAPVLNPATIAHPALALFRDTSTLNVGTARFLTTYALDPVDDPANPDAVHVMIRFSNGAPAFVERRVGLGRVILAASGAGAGWNQAPLKPSYVPFVYQLACYLGQGAGADRNVRRREPLVLRLPVALANRPVRVTDPSGRTTTQNSVLDARGVTFTYPATDAAGLYTVAVAGSQETDAFAVGLDPVESDLAPEDPGRALERAGVPSGAVNISRSAKDIESSVHRARYGAEIWRPLIWLILPLLFVESMLAQRFGRRG